MKKVHQFIIIITSIIIIQACKKSNNNQNTNPDADITAPPTTLGLNNFYKKYIDADGIPIISSNNVPAQALRNAKDIVTYMLRQIPDAKAKMIMNRLRVGIIGINERPTQMPEYADLYTAFPGTDWDNRARAYGATLARPLTTNCEENMLCLGASDRYRGEEILTHEFAHAIHELGLRYSQPNFDSQLLAAYNNAIANNLWANTYAISDVREYWAEGVQDWFNCNLEAIPSNGVHNQVNTRSELQSYDPTLYNLIKLYFSDAARKHGNY